MFHIDATFEDTRLIATSKDGHGYDAILTDNLTGAQFTLPLKTAHLAMVLAINLHPDGEPDGFEAMYAELEPLLLDCPLVCRPIP